jgi:sec-independent protein translocase protein TatB
MFNIGSGELALIAVVALLVLGPKRLPELARGIGKFMREFRRQTDEVRGVVEREFYKMDQEISIKEPPLAVRPADETVALGANTEPEALPAPAEHVESQLTKGMPQGEPVAAAPEAKPEEPKS